MLLVGAVFYDAKPTPQGLAGALLALAAITAYSLLKLQANDGGGGAGRDARLAAVGNELAPPSGEAEEFEEDRRPLTRE